MTFAPDSGLAHAATVYRFRSRRWRFVSVLLLLGCSETIVAPPIAPARPTDLRATLIPPNSVRLAWIPVALGGEGLTYSIVRNDVRVGEVTTSEFVDTGLVSNMTYTWFVSAKTREGGVSAPSEPVIMSFGDIEPPKVTTATPANGASGLSRIPTPTVTFSEPMIPLSVSAGSIVATLTTNGEPVYGTVNYNSASLTADFWPLAILAARTSVTITVGTGARDIAGNGLDAPFSFTFVTGDAPENAAQLPPSVEPLLISQGGGVAGSRDIFKLRTDGTGKVNLTNHPTADLHGAWSPDGRHVAFASDRNGTFDIFIMRDDGTGLRQVTFDVKDQTQPRWSLDARRIVFTSTKEGIPPSSNFSTPGDIWAMNADGTQQVNLTRSPMVYEFWPQWSPDGRRLLFTRTEFELSSSGGSTGISKRLMLANADGSGASPLRESDPNYDDDVAAWSPDGKQIAFSAFNVRHDNFFENFLLFLIDVDGSNLRQITKGGSQRFPAWSPDGRSLFYSTSAFNEFWGRFGELDARKRDLETGVETSVAPRSPASEVMSPQSWRR